MAVPFLKVFRTEFRANGAQGKTSRKTIMARSWVEVENHLSEAAIARSLKVIPKACAGRAQGHGVSHAEEARRDRSAL